MPFLFTSFWLVSVARRYTKVGLVVSSLSLSRFTMRPLRVLNVAEKNDAAKELSRIMSRGQCNRREGYSKFNKIYEFDFNIFGSHAKMVMTSLSGHMMSLDFTASHQKWYSCAPVALFSAPVAKYVGEDFIPIKRTLEREVRGCQVLIIWTDCDREGENIGFEVVDVCQKICPNIRIYRANFSEITPQSISRAVQNLVEPDILQSQAVDVRMELDLRIGAAFTRFQTLRLRKVFPNVLSDNLISYGSCQFPTLGFVVERYKQVQQFVPETFYKIKVTHEMEDAKVDFAWKRGRLFNRLPCLILYQICLENPTAKVLSTSSRPKSKWRPLPLDTVELEKLASRKLKINAKETMKIAEKLYNQGFISYPRTETNIFPKSLDLVPLIQNQTVDQDWGAFAASVLVEGPNPRSGNKTDNAHPPIHPTKYTNGLQGNEKRVYEFVVRHFLACCSQDAKGHETSVEIEIAGERFTATGLMIIARNYLDVYPYDKWNAKTIPVYNQGEEFQPSAIEMIDGETRPPPLLSEADLIALMEKHGIGTDATHAEHIETIKNRCYVGVQGDGTFLPGQLGMGLVEGYDLMGFELSKPRLRAELEADLKRICEGTKNKDVVLAEQIQKYKEQFVKAVEEAIKLDQALTRYFGNPQEFIDEVLGSDSEAGMQPVRLCPRCQTEQMVLKKTKDGSYMVGCLGYPRCRSSAFFPKFVLEAAVHESVCQQCQPGEIRKISFKFKRGSVPPMMPLEYVGCIAGCNDSLRELLDLKDLTRLPSESAGGSNARGRGQRNSSTRGNNRAIGRGRGATASTRRGTNRGANQQGFRPSVQNGQGSDTQSAWNTGHPRGSERNNGLSTGGQDWGQANRDNSIGALGFSQFFSGDSSGGKNDENCVVCTCGIPAVTFTVKKDGPNKGRPFYRCTNRDSGCGFFLWADNEPESSLSSSSFIQPVPLQPSTSFNIVAGSNADLTAARRNMPPTAIRSVELENTSPSCHCNDPAVSRTVSKEGPNKGRPFYCCSKPRGQGCDFFEWGDVPDTTSGTRNKFRGTTGADHSGAGKKRRCGNCHQEGHTKRSCPMNR